MNIVPFAGDLADVTGVDALCSSTNVRLSLMMGTGGSLRERGGFEILRACQDILAAEPAHRVRAGTVHATTAGRLPVKAILHCVASDGNHLSSAEIIRACVLNALAAADAAGYKSLAMPVFGTGHARFKWNTAMETMAAALREARTSVEKVVIVVIDPDRVDDVIRFLR